MNRLTGKYLEIPAASTTAGTAADQWQNPACDCQLWTFQSQSGDAWTLQNVRSGLKLNIGNASTAAGAEGTGWERAERGLAPRWAGDVYGSTGGMGAGVCGSVSAPGCGSGT
ncbi:RICIN domain-containing protein [Streptomyces gilvus]|uniref:RICIN domain-containing protein n=1 Tax=Streptomyces gilvus TaxID=2920937 RepID=UPI001F0F1FA4|nr:RICIN domain-containing protein [Streptomyces sp. CME 23]MCH5676551.1 RICIN domain-containing protein [Streptomyces sp. CME 23]